MATDLETAASASALKEAGLLISGLSAKDRKAVQQVISDSLFNGWSSTKTATRIKQVVGLSPRQLTAVTNYRAGQIAAGLTPKQADASATRYAERLRKARAALIADYEVRKATADAKRAEWAAQQKAGTVSNRAVRVFKVHKDERTCPACRGLNGRRHSLGNAVNAPPLHPNCRCTEELVDEGIVKSSLVYDEKEIVAKVAAVRDGDGDGFIHDGTPLQRPAVPKAAVFDLPDDLDITWIERGERKYGEVGPDAFKAIAKVFTYTDPKTGFHTKVQAAEVFGLPNDERASKRPGVNVHGVILNATGHEVGRFERVLQTPMAGAPGSFARWNAGHEELVLFPDFQGQGFDSRWNAHLFDIYRSGDFARVDVFANMDVGGYAQAMKGFDWERPTEKVMWGLRSLVDHKDELETPDWLVAQASDIIKRAEADDHVTAWEVANLGRKEWAAGDHWQPKFIRGRNPDLSFTSGKYGLNTVGREAIRNSTNYDSDTWATNNHVGKAILLGDRWHGVLDLDAPPKPVKKDDDPRNVPTLSGYDLAMAHHQWVESLYAEGRGRVFNPPAMGARSCYTNYHLDVEATDADMARFDAIVAGFETIEKTRHVRTPEGAKRYKLPIGSPIPERPKILPARHKRHRLPSEVPDAKPADGDLFRRFVWGDSSMDFRAETVVGGNYPVNTKGRGFTKAMLGKNIRNRVKNDNPDWRQRMLNIDAGSMYDLNGVRSTSSPDPDKDIAMKELRIAYAQSVGIDNDATGKVFIEVARQRYEKQRKFLAEDRQTLIDIGVTAPQGVNGYYTMLDQEVLDGLISRPFGERTEGMTSATTDLQLAQDQMYQMDIAVRRIAGGLRQIEADDREATPNLTFDQLWILRNRHNATDMPLTPGTLPTDQMVTFDPIPEGLSYEETLAEARLAVFVRSTIDQWAETSSDSNQRSLATQIAASKWAEDELGVTIGDRSWMNQTQRKHAYEDAQNLLSPEHNTQPVFNMFFSAMYGETQDYLKANGVDSVKLQRGMSFEDAHAPQWLRNAKEHGKPSAKLRKEWQDRRKKRSMEITRAQQGHLKLKIEGIRSRDDLNDLSKDQLIEEARYATKINIGERLTELDIADETQRIIDSDRTLTYEEAHEMAADHVINSPIKYANGGYLNKGVIFEDPGVRVEGHATMNPLTSWGVHPETAMIFQGYSDYATRITANIPRENIMSLAVTGMGALIENEFVVMGLPIDEFYVTLSREPKPL